MFQSNTKNSHEKGTQSTILEAHSNALKKKVIFLIHLNNISALGLLKLSKVCTWLLRPLTGREMNFDFDLIPELIRIG